MSEFINFVFCDQDTLETQSRRLEIDYRDLRIRLLSDHYIAVSSFPHLFSMLTFVGRPHVSIMPPLKRKL